MSSTFKGFMLAGLIAIAPVAFTASPAAAQPAPQRAATCNTAFLITNATGKTIGWVHARRVGEQAWGPDMLGREVIMPGAVIALRLPAAGQYQLKAVGMSGETYQGSVSACDVVNVTIQ